MQATTTARMLATAAVLFAGLMLAPASAHHSGAMFDDKVELILTGVVTRFDYLNPHAWLYVNVKNDDDTFTEWGFELAAPPRLRRQGISPNYWREGDLITLKTNPLKDGRPAGNLLGAINADGATFGNPGRLQQPTP